MFYLFLLSWHMLIGMFVFFCGNCSKVLHFHRHVHAFLPLSVFIVMKYWRAVLYQWAGKWLCRRRIHFGSAESSDMFLVHPRAADLRPQMSHLSQPRLWSHSHSAAHTNQEAIVGKWVLRLAGYINMHVYDDTVQLNKKIRDQEASASFCSG